MKRGSQKSLPELLNILWQEGFFSTAKDIAEISGGLAVKGYHSRVSSLGVALIREVRSGNFINRVKESGKWKYIQRHPSESPPGQRMELFARYDFHSRIKEVSFEQFEGGFFKEAIQNALVEVVDQVKTRLDRPKDKNGHDLDGDDLMNRAFGCDGGHIPMIKFNQLRDGLDYAEQRGLLYLFKGIVGVRDRKAHLNFIQRDPLKTIEYLSLASLLMRLLDEHASTRKRKK